MANCLIVVHEASQAWWHTNVTPVSTWEVRQGAQECSRPSLAVSNKQIGKEDIMVEKDLHILVSGIILGQVTAPKV